MPSIAECAKRHLVSTLPRVRCMPPTNAKPGHSRGHLALTRPAPTAQLRGSTPCDPEVVMHRHAVATLSLVFVAACSRTPAQSSSSPAPVQSASSAQDVLVAKARAIHAHVITIDTHKDIPDNYATPEADPKTMSS